MTYRAILEYVLFNEALDVNNPVLKSQRFKVLDSIESNGYEMYLLHTDLPAYPKDMRYQIAVQRSDMDFLNPEHQMSSVVSLGLDSIKNIGKSVKSLQSLANKLREWIKTYGTLSMASLSEEKSKKWMMGLKWLGFNVQEKAFNAGYREVTYYLIS